MFEAFTNDVQTGKYSTSQIAPPDKTCRYFLFEFWDNPRTLLYYLRILKETLSNASTNGD